jgi:FkbM family methyltransferase
MDSNPWMPTWCGNLIPPGTAALDVGANVGNFLPILSQAVGPTGHVYAIEPGPLLWEILHPIAVHYSNVSLHAYAFGTEAKQAPVFHYGDWSLLPVDKDDVRYRDRKYHPGQPNELKGEFVATFLPLDTFVDLWIPSDMQVGFVKVDVDGAEYQVLQGASRTLARDRPILFVEIGQECAERFGSTIEILIDFLVSRGYRFVAQYQGHPFPVSAADLCQLLWSMEVHCLDVMCLPQEHPSYRSFHDRKDS